LAEAIEEAFKADVELIGGHSGVLDVVVDGRTVFSKHKEGYKPMPAELVKLLR
jgi:predicted Rdx family selenoprotein